MEQAMNSPTPVNRMAVTVLPEVGYLEMKRETQCRKDAMSQRKTKKPFASPRPCDFALKSKPIFLGFPKVQLASMVFDLGKGAVVKEDEQ